MDTTNTTAPEASEPLPQAQDIQMETDHTAQPELRDTAIWVGGIDDLKQKQVEEFVIKYTPIEFAIEWIDDNSLNLVFDTAGLASDALAALQESTQDPTEESAAEPLFVRSSKPHPSIACNFQLRYATTADKKATNSKELSKYYLKNGAPSSHFNRKRFGTSRSAPMKYGGKDLINREKISRRTGDLFPHLSGGGDDDLFPHLKGKPSQTDDLFPHLVKGGGIKKNRSRNNKTKKNEDDLFPLKKEESVYSRMNY